MMFAGKHEPRPTVRPACVILALLALGLAACIASGPAQASDIPPGDGRQTATVAGTDLTVFTYRPRDCRPGLLLLVFHGTGRQAASYRAHAEPLADRVCAIVVAPEFDANRFPRRCTSTAEPPGKCRATERSTVPLLATWARAAAGAPDLPFVLLGHSAGAQFLGRVAAFVPTGAAGIILANPSTWVLPSATIAAPFGFGPTGSDEAVRTYLAEPITVLLGTADTGSKELATSPSAMAQGPNRYTRGINTFRMAQDVARSHGWRFGWTLSEVPGVGHSAASMFASPLAAEAVRRAVPAAADR